MYWKKIQINEFEKHALGFLNYYKNRSDKFKSYNRFWTSLNPEHLDGYLSIHEDFKNELNKIGIVKEITLITLNNEGTTLHTDHTSGLNNGVNIRLNIPIANCEGSYTCFYEIPESEINNFKESNGGTKVWNYDLVYQIKPITVVELKQPTLLRISYPHAVLCIKNKFPRIAMTISFTEDPKI
jgi:hypothetical protein